MLKVLKFLGIALIVSLFASVPAIIFFKDTPLVKGLGDAVGKAVPTFGADDEVDLDVMVIKQKEMTVADQHRSGAFLPGRQYLMNIPDGFEIAVADSKLSDVGPLAVFDDETVFYAQRNLKQIFAWRRSADGSFTTEKLGEEHGEDSAVIDIAYNDGWLYVFEETAVHRHDIVDGKLGERKEILIEGVPAPRGNRGALLVAPNNKLYLSINGGCVLCEPEDERRGTIIEVDIATKENRIFARGLREVQAMFYDTATDTILAADNKIGDRETPGYVELNALVADKHYGWPYCFQDKKVFSQFSDTRTEFCAGTEPPVYSCSDCGELTSITALEGNGWPNYVQGKLLLAFSGIKENGVASGYKLSLYDGVTEKRADQLKDFLYGWLLGSENWGTPFDIVSTAGNHLVISDNFAGALYDAKFSVEK